jgi:hypothetical protein
MRHGEQCLLCEDHKMNQRLWSTIGLFLLVAGGSALAKESAPSCQPTHPQGGWVSNEELRVGSPDGGRIVFRPGGPGFVTANGSLGWKFLWERLVTGTLQIEGRRLDGPADPLRAEVPSAYGVAGIQPTYLIFPLPGCWEITGRVRDKPVSMVLLVEKVGDGPQWRRN